MVSMKGIGIKNCDNCLNEEQTMNVDDIPNIRQRVEDAENSLGALAESLDNEFDIIYDGLDGKETHWIQVPFSTALEYEPYKSLILENGVLKYDLKGFYRVSGETFSFFVKKGVTISAVTVPVLRMYTNTSDGVDYFNIDKINISINTLLTGQASNFNLSGLQLKINKSDGTMTFGSSAKNTARSAIDIFVRAKTLNVNSGS